MQLGNGKTFIVSSQSRRHQNQYTERTFDIERKTSAMWQKQATRFCCFSSSAAERRASECVKSRTQDMRTFATAKEHEDC